VIVEFVDGTDQIPVDQLLECVTTAGNVSDGFLLSLHSALTPLRRYFDY